MYVVDFRILLGISSNLIFVSGNLIPRRGGGGGARGGREGGRGKGFCTQKSGEQTLDDHNCVRCTANAGIAYVHVQVTLMCIYPLLYKIGKTWQIIATHIHV